MTDETPAPIGQATSQVATAPTLHDIATGQPVLMSAGTQSALAAALAACPAEALQTTLTVQDTSTGRAYGVILAGKINGRWDVAGYLGRPAAGHLEGSFTAVYHLGR